MLYIIGLGLNEKGISLEGFEIIKNCKKVYLETYTVDFPYNIKELENLFNKNIIPLIRSDVEDDKLIKESKKEDICLLVYGSPLFATTHISLIIEAKKSKVNTKVIYSASVFDAISECGLELYKFGKISSMPKWQKNYTPDSFLLYVIENNSIKAHSLVLIDIGMNINDSLNQLETSLKNKGQKINEIIICCNLGTKNSNFYFGTINNLKKISNKIKPPYCFIIPGEMHFIEKEAIERFRI